MTEVAVKEMQNNTTPPSQGNVDKLVFEERRPSAGNKAVVRYLLLLGIMPTSAADALPMRSLSSDLTSATDQVIPYIADAIRNPGLDSATQILDPASSARAAYESRLADLRSYGEDDGIELSIVSEREFLDFACTEPQTKLASVVLLDNGNLRAVWRMGQQEVGVQFCGGGLIQYLISREYDDGHITHTADRGTFEDLLAALEDADLGRLLYE